jgi:hypothetical protein
MDFVVEAMTRHPLEPFLVFCLRKMRTASGVFPGLSYQRLVFEAKRHSRITFRENAQYPTLNKFSSFFII